MSIATTTILDEGEARIILRVDFLSDGATPGYLGSPSTGEFVVYPILTPSMLTPKWKGPLPSPMFRLMQAWWGFSWFDVSLITGTLQPLPLWTFTRDAQNHLDFRHMGGLVDLGVLDNPGPGTPDDDNGILSVTTNGFSVVGSQGSMVLEIKKLFNNLQ